MGNSIKDIIIIGAGPAGLMAASTAAQEGLGVLVIEKKKDITKVMRTCSAQFVLDEEYEGEKICLEDGKIRFTRNQFEVPYSGRTIEVIHNNYISPSGYKVQFAHEDGRPSSVKFDKGQLLKQLREQCEERGVEFWFECLACGGNDDGKQVQIEVRNKGKREVVSGKKLIIAEGVNASITETFGFNKGRKFFGMPLVEAFTVIDTKGFEPNSWNQFYGDKYHPFGELMVAPSIEGLHALEVTVTGMRGMFPETLFQKMIKESPLKENFADAKVIQRTGCSVKSFVSLTKPCEGNVMVIGDSAAHIEVIVQGALMCGYHAGLAMAKELRGEDGFTEYTEWWKKAFDFNRMDGLEFVKLYGTLGIKARFADQEIDYLFKLLDGKRLCGNFSQFEVPKNFWRAILECQDQIKDEKPEIYDKIIPIKELQEKGFL
ncbi:MAG: NAD(P)/FAD-dependent oxidoreductase [Clostridium sp.]|nr:NAD(P)/FAD-dependent oxidoreductase [Clostridium sp.]